MLFKTKNTRNHYYQSKTLTICDVSYLFKNTLRVIKLKFHKIQI